MLNRIQWINLLLVLLALSWPPNAAATTIIIHNANLIPMDTEQVLMEHSLVIEDGEITRITHPEKTLNWPQATIIDASGKYVIPGLAEMHAHVPGSSRGAEHTQKILDLYLANGITLIRGMLGEPSHLKLRAELAAHRLDGPRLITSGPSFNGRSVSSADQAAQMVKAQKQAGYDFLKLHPGLEAEEYAAIVKTAETVGIPYAGHVSYAVGIPRTLTARQATIDHLDGYAQLLLPAGHALADTPPQFFGVNYAADLSVDSIEEWATKTAAAGVWNVPTQSLLENLLGEQSADALEARPEMRYVSTATREQWRGAVERSKAQVPAAAAQHFIQVRRNLIKALHKAGAGLLLGSDAPQIMNVPGFAIHHELNFMVQSGLTPYQALRSGTVNVAEFFNDPKRGSIKPGNIADLVLLEHNPLEDIRASASIWGVLHDGRWYPREVLEQKLAAIADNPM